MGARAAQAAQAACPPPPCSSRCRRQCRAAACQCSGNDGRDAMHGCTATHRAAALRRGAALAGRLPDDEVGLADGVDGRQARGRRGHGLACMHGQRGAVKVCRTRHNAKRWKDHGLAADIRHRQYTGTHGHRVVGVGISQSSINAMRPLACLQPHLMPPQPGSPPPQPAAGTLAEASSSSSRSPPLSLARSQGVFRGRGGRGRGGTVRKPKRRRAGPSCCQKFWGVPTRERSPVPLGTGGSLERETRSARTASLTPLLFIPLATHARGLDDLLAVRAAETAWDLARWAVTSLRQRAALLVTCGPSGSPLPAPSPPPPSLPSPKSGPFFF